MRFQHSTNLACVCWQEMLVFETCPGLPLSLLRLLLNFSPLARKCLFTWVVAKERLCSEQTIAGSLRSGIGGSM